MKKTRAKRQKNISGPQIAAIRKKKGMTQLKLAEEVKALGVTLDRASLAKLETRNRAVMDFELVALSQVFHVDVNRLLPSRTR